MKRLTLLLVLAAFSAAVVAGSARAVAPNCETEPAACYDFKSFSLSFSGDQAGGHSDFTVQSAQTTDSEGAPYATTASLEFRLPPGIVGDVAAFPTCTAAELTASVRALVPREKICPSGSQVGITKVVVGHGHTFQEPVYNMVPGAGQVARFGFIAYLLPVLVGVRLDPSRHYGLTSSVEGLSTVEPLVAAETTLWGDPADESHDALRITPEEAANNESHPHKSEFLPTHPAFMSAPTNCEAPGMATAIATSYAAPGESRTATALLEPQLTGCGLLEFEPAMSIVPTTEEAETGSGLEVKLSFPQRGLEHPNLPAEAHLKRNEVILPEGVTVNPSEAAGGLGICSEADLARETATSRPNEGCPETSKIGTAISTTPVLDEAAEGALYLAKPYDNPFHSLLAIYMVLKIPNRGVVVKLPGKVVPNPVTGQLVTTFDELPQLPVSSFKLHFREGARAPLVTPPTCGEYVGTSVFDSWGGQHVVTHPSFLITSGLDRGPCPAGGVPPFQPSLVAGTLNNAAGSYSPLYLRIERKDGEQEITGFSTLLPPGVTGNLTGIPFCGEAEVQRAREQTGARAESEPACPAASQIGRTVAEAGVGSVLAQTPGRLYLGGPFEGAPFSVVSVTSAHVGPFDLGTVVVHLPLRIDPTTAQVSIPSGPADQIPHIIDGIVVHLRAIRVYIDRPDFTLNPTNCQHMTFAATVSGSGANFASSADDVPVTVNDPFQAADCQALKFAPVFKASTSGKTSRKNGASLHVTLAYPKGSFGKDANIHSVKVNLPKQLPSRLTTLQKACTSAQFEADPAACPAASRVGTAKAITPILPVPLQGPAYFVSHGGAKFPELVIVLQGYGVTIDLHGETFINEHTNVTSSTFRTVPDQPVTSFELTLPQGPNSALAAPSGLCNVMTTKIVKKKVRVHGKTVTRKVKKSVPGSLLMPTLFVAQNGMTLKQNTTIGVSGCPRHVPARGKAKPTGGQAQEEEITGPSAAGIHAEGASDSGVDVAGSIATTSGGAPGGSSTLLADASTIVAVGALSSSLMWSIRWRSALVSACSLAPRAWAMQNSPVARMRPKRRASVAGPSKTSTPAPRKRRIRALKKVE